MAEIRLALDEADGRLPEVCMCCGQPSTLVKTRTMSWCPPWVGVLILFGILPYVVVTMVMTKRAKVQVPLCADHWGHWFNRNLLIWGSFFALFLGTLAAFLLALEFGPRGRDSIEGFVCLGGLVLFLVWVVIAIIAQNTAIRPKEITDREIVLQSVSPAFVEAVREADHRGWSRRQRFGARDDFDDDEPPPRNRAAPTDAIQEDRPKRDGEKGRGSGEFEE